MTKESPIIRCESHLVLVRQLLCCVCFSDESMCDRVAHHLLRTPEHGMGQKSGDDKVVPLCVECHDAQVPGSLHHHGNELAWFARHGIADPLKLAELLWACEGNFERAYMMVQPGVAAKMISRI